MDLVSRTQQVLSGPEVYLLMYLRDADRSSWACPVCLDEVPLVGRQQVILHRLYEKIFTSVVVFDQSFFLDNL